MADEPAAALHLRHDEVGHPAAVEAVGAAARGSPRAWRRARAAAGRCRARGGPPFGRKVARRGGEDREPRAVAADGLAAIVVDHEAFAGQSDGGLDHRGERQLAVASGAPRSVRRRRPGTPAARWPVTLARSARRAASRYMSRLARGPARSPGSPARAPVPSAMRITMNPPPPMLPASGCTTASAKPTATAASTALPPRAEHVSPDGAGERMSRDHHRRGRLGHSRLARQLPVPRDSRGRLGRRGGAAGAADQQDEGEGNDGRSG